MSPQGPKENFDQLIRDGYTSIDSELARKAGSEPGLRTSLEVNL